MHCRHLSQHQFEIGVHSISDLSRRCSIFQPPSLIISSSVHCHRLPVDLNHRIKNGPAGPKHKTAPPSGIQGPEQGICRSDCSLTTTGPEPAVEALADLPPASGSLDQPLTVTNTWSLPSKGCCAENLRRPQHDSETQVTSTRGSSGGRESRPDGASPPRRIRASAIVRVALRMGRVPLLRHGVSISSAPAREASACHVARSIESEICRTVQRHVARSTRRWL